MKEWEESHEQKIGELESLFSSLRKKFYKQDDKLRRKRLERIFKTLELKKKEEKNNSTEGGEDEGKGTKGYKCEDTKRGKGKGGKRKNPKITISLEEREKSLAKWEKMLQECFSTNLSLGDVFGSSPLYK